MWNRTEIKIKILLLRHGMTDGNKEKRYIGRTDEALCEAAKIDLSDRKKMGQYPEITRLFVSPMLRCLETAQILYPDMEMTKIEQFREMDFGIFEGKNYQELSEEPEYQKWVSGGCNGSIPGGESKSSFTSRCLEGVDVMLQDLFTNNKPELALENQEVGMIVHGGTIMSILSAYAGGEYFDYQVATGEGYYTTWVISADRIRVVDVVRICEKREE